jgi:hypothetical protein
MGFFAATINGKLHHAGIQRSRSTCQGVLWRDWQVTRRIVGCRGCRSRRSTRRGNKEGAELGNVVTLLLDAVICRSLWFRCHPLPNGTEGFRQQCVRMILLVIHCAGTSPGELEEDATVLVLVTACDEIKSVRDQLCLWSLKTLWLL